jgi:hypothetical protein
LRQPGSFVHVTHAPLGFKSIYVLEAVDLPGMGQDGREVEKVIFTVPRLVLDTPERKRITEEFLGGEGKRRLIGCC